MPSIGAAVFALCGAALCQAAYTVPPGYSTAVLAGGCFWCMEEGFERYVPGVVEAVSGFSAGDNEYPTYRNHPGHYEVILIMYDPALSSYETLLQYYWRNVDPLDPFGQFCDKGHAYKPAIFYADEAERLVAEKSKAAIQAKHPEWKMQVPIAQREPFWEAEAYHQNYYLKNPEWYHHYKTGCRRVKRLKEVWGETEYYCFHSSSSDQLGEEDCEEFSLLSAVNASGVEVVSEINQKDAPPPSTALPKELMLAAVFGGLLGASVLAFFFHRARQRSRAVSEEGKESGGGQAIALA